MLQLNRIDLTKVLSNRPRTTTKREAEALKQALAASKFKVLYTESGAKVYWYILSPPTSLRGKHYGVADSREQAEEVVAKLLGPTNCSKAASV